MRAFMSTEEANALQQTIMLCTVILIDMKINFGLKNKYPSIEFCYKNKAVMITYWGGIKFTKNVIHGV